MSRWRDDDVLALSRVEAASGCTAEEDEDWRVGTRDDVLVAAVAVAAAETEEDG